MTSSSRSSRKLRAVAWSAPAPSPSSVRRGPSCCVPEGPGDAGSASLELARGDSVWIPADEPRPAVTGIGSLFVASTGL